MIIKGKLYHCITLKEKTAPLDTSVNIETVYPTSTILKAVHYG